MDVACDSAQLWGQQGDLLRSGHPAALNACWLVGDAPADTLLACDPAPCRQGIKLSLGFYEDILVPEFALQVGAAAHIKLPVLGRTAMHAHPCGSVCAGGGGGVHPPTALALRRSGRPCSCGSSQRIACRPPPPARLQEPSMFDQGEQVWFWAYNQDEDNKM